MLWGGIDIWGRKLVDWESNESSVEVDVTEIAFLK